ncbi:reverse transcriptase domain-containing protein [Cupriavidus sp. CP313]
MVLANADRAKWILEADIRSCFDEISHDWLVANVPTDKAILQRWLKAGYLHNHVFHSTEAGTPQGGIVSPTLMNLTLDGLERTLQAKFYRHGRNVSKINIIRYADDFVITGATREVLVDEVRPVVEQFLAERGLSLSSEKTRVTHIEDGFDFLGMNVRKYGGKLLIKPAITSVQRFLRKYYRHVVSKRIFSKVSQAIWLCLWRWARRRHPNKGAHWVRQKYFRTVGARHWVFGTETGKKLSTGKPELLTLYDIASTPIRRHCRIKVAANPFDPQWESYFEERLGLTMLDSLKGRIRLIRLWLNQERACPVCRQMITKSSGWRLFRLEREIDGGTDASRNLVMLHPDCHRVARGRRVSVVKPAPAAGL